MRDGKFDELFEQFLPSASEDAVEAARWKILERVRANVAVNRESLEATITLNHGDYHILLALENGERHAYAIMADVEELTEGATKFGPGTFFTSISRLITAGWIEETRERPDPRVNDEPRQYYRLTGRGQRVLAAESDRLALKLVHRHEQEALRCL